MKKLLLPLCLALLICSCTPKPVKLNGVVIYNNNSKGYRVPEKWVDIFIISKINTEKAKYKNIFHNSMAFSMIKADYGLAKANEDKEIEVLKQKLDTVSKIVTIKTTTDANGEFTAILKPGEYYIITHSSREYDINYAECNGLLKLVPIDIKPNEEQKIKIEFN